MSAPSIHYAPITHTPLILARRARQLDVATVQERGRRSADDADLLAEALIEERVMLTNDTDSLVLAADLASKSQMFAPIFYWPQQQRTIGYLVRGILREATATDYQTACSCVFYL